MNFYVYEKDPHQSQLLKYVQQFLAETELPASVYAFCDTDKQCGHLFALSPALFLDNHLILEGDVPVYQDLFHVLNIVSRIYGDTSSCDGCCGCSEHTDDSNNFCNHSRGCSSI